MSDDDVLVQDERPLGPELRCDDELEVARAQQCAHDLRALVGHVRPRRREPVDRSTVVSGQVPGVHEEEARAVGEALGGAVRDRSRDRNRVGVTGMSFEHLRTPIRCDVAVVFGDRDHIPARFVQTWNVPFGV